MRVLALVVLVAGGLIGTGCGGNSTSSKTPTSGSLSGNWQINMTQNYPQPFTLSASGFLVEANGALTGSVQGPYFTGSSTSPQYCGGAGPLTGMVSERNVTFSLDPGGTIFNFIGVVSANQAMSGTYSGFGGACFSQSASSGTFTANLIPPLNGSFTGTFLSSNYMPALTGSTSAVPVSVSGSFTQSPSGGGSSASLTGIITAVDYPCFKTASLTGTISGTSVYLSIYGYNGIQIGTIGTIGSLGQQGASNFPATWDVPPNVSAVIGTGESGFQLIGTPGPCPAIYNSSGSARITTDQGDVTLNLE